MCFWYQLLQPACVLASFSFMTTAALPVTPWLWVLDTCLTIVFASTGIISLQLAREDPELTTPGHPSTISCFMSLFYKRSTLARAWKLSQASP